MSLRASTRFRFFHCFDGRRADPKFASKDAESEALTTEVIANGNPTLPLSTSASDEERAYVAKLKRAKLHPRFAHISRYLSAVLMV